VNHGFATSAVAFITKREKVHIANRFVSKQLPLNIAANH
jgi:hypothetical protein